MLPCQDVALFLSKGRLFFPPIGRGFDGGREGSDTGSYLLKGNGSIHPTLYPGSVSDCCPCVYFLGELL